MSHWRLAHGFLSLSTSEFAKLIAEETDKWGKVIRAAHVTDE